jgi:hypothetical protein
MASIAVQISSNSVRQSSRSVGLSSKAAWAKYVASRWKTNRVGSVQTEWDLTEGEAKGLCYGQASQATIDKIKLHKRGGWAVSLAVDAILLGQPLEHFIQSEAERARHEREQWEARERSLRGAEEAVRSLRAERRGHDWPVA